MMEKISFVRFPLALVLLFFIGRLVMGAFDVSYDAANRVFSMVILQVHLALIWSAVGRGFKGYRLKDSVTAVVLIVLFSQILIFAATAVSYVTGIDTYFNLPAALNSDGPVEFSPAMMARFFGLVANTFFGAIIATIGWFLGGLIQKNRPSDY